MKYISGFKYYYLDMLFFFARYLCLKLTNKSRNDHGPDMDNDEEKLDLFLQAFLQASCKKKLHLPLLKSAFFLKGDYVRRCIFITYLAIMIQNAVNVPVYFISTSLLHFY